MSVIILGFVLLITVLTLGSRSVGTRFVLLDLERKDSSKALAEGCVQVAIIEIVNNSVSPSSYPKVLWVDPDFTVQCKIHSIALNTPSSGYATIQTSASSKNATTNLEVVWNIALEKVDSFHELPNL